MDDLIVAASTAAIANLSNSSSSESLYTKLNTLDIQKKQKRRDTQWRLD
jgi:hypothetical protein